MPDQTAQPHLRNFFSVQQLFLTAEVPQNAEVLQARSGDIWLRLQLKTLVDAARERIAVYNRAPMPVDLFDWTPQD